VRSPKIEREYEPSYWKDTCHEITPIEFLDIRGQKGKSFNFASGELAKRIRAVHLRVDRWHTRRHRGQTFIDQFVVS
jgi:hypothetical protein